jgi:signal transduction histidine kinase
MSEALLDRVHKVPLFSQAEPDVLAELLRGAQLSKLDAGERLFNEGDSAESYFVILSGRVMVFRTIRGQRIPVTEFAQYDTAGEVPLLNGTPHLADAVALEPSEVLRIPSDTFWQLLGRCPSARKQILEHMRERQAALNTMTAQREKLLSLGTLAAGLAHELNNPASAASRAAQALTQQLHGFNAHIASMLAEVLFQEDASACSRSFEPLLQQVQLEGPAVSPLDLADREDDIADWLSAIGLAKPFQVAGTLASVGFTRAFLEPFFDGLDPSFRAASVQWAAGDLELRKLGRELVLATERISTLVGALKKYTYMDTSVEQREVDVREGIEDTLVILGHKLRRKNVALVREFQEIPCILGYGGELNQVWTNLIDNAIHAVDDGGRIVIRTIDDSARGRVLVQVEDNGHGIPRDVLPRIFEPFFTTKRQAEGTGLGLEISYRIVTNLHKGHVRVESVPGRTLFEVCLPASPCPGDGGQK